MSADCVINRHSYSSRSSGAGIKSMHRPLLCISVTQTPLLQSSCEPEIKRIDAVSSHAHRTLGLRTERERESERGQEEQGEVCSYTIRSVLCKSSFQSADIYLSFHVFFVSLNQQCVMFSTLCCLKSCTSIAITTFTFTFHTFHSQFLNSNIFD